MVPHLVNSNIIAANQIAAGPITGRPFDFGIQLGDAADNTQRNEVRWFIDLLDGSAANNPSGLIDPDSGNHDRYEGPQGSDPWPSPDGEHSVLELANDPFFAPGLRRADGSAIPWYSVLGNHDAKVLEIRQGQLSKQPKPTHAQVAQRLTPADWEYLAALPLWIRLEEHGVLIVHAGLAPNVPLHEQRREDLLNMRSITPEGRTSKRASEGVPWASAWPGPEHVAFGHDAVRGLQRHPHATGLDTGCVYGRSLTALIFPERRLVSVPARRVWAEPQGS
jgi:3',5'-cyclic AMP phosphodiesterase CpdA